MSTDSFNRRFAEVYGAVVTSYPAMRANTDFERYATTTELMVTQVPAGGHIVDAGAWPGALTTCLGRFGFQVTAIDKDPKRAVTWSRGTLLATRELEKEPDAPPFEAVCRQEGIGVIAADIEQDPLPLPNGSVDAVLLTEVIEHLWHNPLYTLSEINRILKPRTGILLLSTPNLTSLRNRINFALGHLDLVIEHPMVSFLKLQRFGHLGHCRLYGPEELRTMLHLFGFHSTFLFAQYPRMQPQAAVASAGAKSDGALAISRGAPSILSKFVRSPSSYWNAACATGLAVAERAIPRLRPQMFVTARKQTDADFDRNYPGETRELVTKNRVAFPDAPLR